MVYILIFLIEILIFFFISKKTTSLIYLNIYKITKNKFWTKYIFSIIFLPGTFLHEISHFLTALFLLVQVGEVEFMPKNTDTGLKLGSVSIGKTDPIRRFLIGAAPVFIGIFVIVFGISQLLGSDLIYDWRIVLVSIYLLFVIGNTMFSSRKDMEGSYKVLIILIVMIIIVNLLKVELPINEFLNTLSDTFKKVSLFLITPIIIDLILINVLNFVDSNK